MIAYNSIFLKQVSHMFYFKNINYKSNNYNLCNIKSCSMYIYSTDRRVRIEEQPQKHTGMLAAGSYQ